MGRTLSNSDSLLYTCTFTKSVFINEIHYDNVGDDIGEFVEVAAPACTDLAGYTIVLYNGNNGAEYGTISLEGPFQNVSDGFGFASFARGGIQNGGPDGLCLVDPAGAVLEFLSYEGVFTAVGGACDMVTSTDIGVSETSSTLAGFSLQLESSGTWVGPILETRGAVNTGQVLPSSSSCTGSTTTSTPPQGSLKTIDEIQGSGLESEFIGDLVKVEGAIVTMIGTFDDDNFGFFIQQGDEDSDPSTSTGIYVSVDEVPEVEVGDIVTVTGTVDQFFGLTQISSSPSLVSVLSSGNPLPEPVSVTLPVTDIKNFEALEGMLVSFLPSEAANKKLVVSEYFNLDRFGTVRVCAADATLGRFFQFTQFNSPDPVGYAAFEDELFRSCIETDDNFPFQNPDPVSINGALTVDKMNLLRGGSEVTGFTGVVFQPFGSGPYRILPTVFEIDQTTNPRPTSPPEETRGVLRGITTAKFVIANGLNYFTSIETCRGSPFRGADGDDGDLAATTLEFDRQAQKTTTALGQLDADIYGLVEIENFNYGAVLDLTARLNAETGKNFKVATVEAGISRAGTDAIRVDVLFDSAKLFLGGVCVLTDEVVQELGLLPGNTDPVFDGQSTNRNPVAVTLSTDVPGQRSVTLVMNHFKSKGGSGQGPDDDQGDGAGNWNFRRTQAAKAILAWIDHPE